MSMGAFHEAVFVSAERRAPAPAAAARGGEYGEDGGGRGEEEVRGK